MLASNKQAEINVRSKEFMKQEIRKPFGYGASYWSKWSTIDYAFNRLGIAQGSDVLDLGCGAGWTTAFLAESGFNVTGLDIVPLNVQTGNKRAKQYKLSAKLQVADMETFSLKQKFDAVLVFDSLHHTAKQEKVIKNIYKHLKPGGWVLFGEPSLLHLVSPHARWVTKHEGVLERGITAYSLRRDAKKAGFDRTVRFFEGTHPYSSRFSQFLWQLVRLIGANFIFAPQTSIWLAAQKPDRNR